MELRPVDRSGLSIISIGVGSGGFGRLEEQASFRVTDHAFEKGITFLDTAELLEYMKTRQIEMRLKAGPAWHQTDYVFTTDNGVPIDPDNLSHEFHRIVDEAELPNGTLHGLRHSFATALLATNVHPAVVQSALGHSSITLTIDTYSHVMPGLEEAAARSIDDVLGDAVAANA